LDSFILGIMHYENERFNRLAGFRKVFKVVIIEIF